MTQKQVTSNIQLFQNSHVENHLRIELLEKKIPITLGISRIKEAIVGICLKGKMNIEVDIKEYFVNENAYFALFPGQIVNLKTISEDFETMYFTISSSLFNEIMYRFPPDFIFYFKKNTIYHDLLENVEFEKKRFERLRTVYDNKENICRREILLSHIRIFYLELYNDVCTLLNNYSNKNNRSYEIYEKFKSLVISDYKVDREVLYYADKLNMTPKYLSLIVKQQSYRNAKKWIDEYVVSEIKLRLHSSNESLQEIAFDLNFADQSFLSKFFKRQTGVSPSDYRKKII